MEIQNLLIAGLGLLGGSTALAARERQLARRVTALARPGRDHEQARKAGVIDAWSTDLEGEVPRADFILLAQPVDIIARDLPQILALASPGTIITDVGSTKARIVAAAESESRAHFIGSHPMAGSHLTGWQNARADLFDGATTYITPTSASNPEALGAVTRFWQTLGARPVLVEPTRHDHLCALLSHVPHLAAVALMELLEDSCEDPHFLRIIAGPGLRDTTRVAMGSPEIWREICDHNNHEISQKLRRLGAICNDIADSVEKADESLMEYLESAAKLRKMMDSDQ